MKVSLLRNFASTARSVMTSSNILTIPGLSNDLKSAPFGTVKYSFPL